MIETNEIYDIPDDMLCEYKEVAKNGEYRLLELTDRHVGPDGIEYDTVEKYFPEYEIKPGKSYFICDDNKLYTETTEL